MALQNFEDSRLSIQDELATTEFQIKIVWSLIIFSAYARILRSNATFHL